MSEEDNIVNSPSLVEEGRKLVTIRRIDKLTPIEGADIIEVATVDGWEVITKKGEFTVGDFCVFFEIDSFLPASDPKFNFLAAKGTKLDEDGVERVRIRTMKMRGVVSQGLALPTKMFKPAILSVFVDENKSEEENYDENIRTLEYSRDGIEEFVDVTKYLRPSERNGGTGTQKCKAAGNFPIVIPKTDEDRVQNIFGRYSNTMKGVGFRKSLKLDGSSQTIAFMNNPDYFVDKVDDVRWEWNEATSEMEVVEVIPYPFQWEEGQISVCSRNLALKFDPTSHFWKAALHDDIPARLKDYCVAHDRQLAVQGEVMGPGIQGNREELTQYQFYAFRIWDIDNRCFLDDGDFLTLCALLGLTTVPQGDIVYFFDEYTDIKSALASADHASIKHKIAEGDVYKSISLVNGVTVHFKVINNKYLLKSED